MRGVTQAGSSKARADAERSRRRALAVRGGRRRLAAERVPPDAPDVHASNRGGRVGAGRTASRRTPGERMGYLIAAYVVVVGSLVAYGLWIQAQRRALERRAAELRARQPSPPAGE